MGILMWLIVGLVAGGVAKLLVPGEDPGGLGTTVLLGMGGAVFGGMVSWMLGLGGLSGPTLGSILIATAGALVLLVGYRLMARR